MRSWQVWCVLSTTDEDIHINKSQCIRVKSRRMAPVLLTVQMNSTKGYRHVVLQSCWSERHVKVLLHWWESACVLATGKYIKEHISVRQKNFYGISSQLHGSQRNTKIKGYSSVRLNVSMRWHNFIAMHRMTIGVTLRFGVTTKCLGNYFRDD